MLLLLLYVPLVLCQGGPEVTLGDGRSVRGVWQKTLGGREVAAFLGIPYARPPKRFQVAEAAKPWTGVLDAVELSSPCMEFNEITMSSRGSEDCLYANVYVPKDNDITLSTRDLDSCPKDKDCQGGSRLLDVIVYIYGGAFSFKVTDFGPKYLLDHDVVMVTFNYRVGTLGFLSTGDAALPGNLGLKDQSQLLKWVSENIRYFGGNPDRVLLAGTSAGGASVHYHLLSPLSRGLFHRAFSMSGSSLCCWTQSENNRQKAEIVARNLGCPTGSSEEMVQCLSEKDGMEVTNQIRTLQVWGYYPFTPVGPVVEPPSPNAFISKYPTEIIRDGEANDVPWLTAFSSEEGLYPAAAFITNETALNMLDEKWNELLPSLLDFEHTHTIFSKDKISQRIRQKYIGDNAVKDNLPGLIKMCSDRLFVDCVVRAARLHADHYRAPVYSYVFNYRGKYSGSEFLSGSKTNYGVCHGDDSSYIFENEVVHVEETASDRRMVDLLTKMVVTFAAEGKPALRGLRDWPDVNKYGDFTYVKIRDAENFEVVINPKMGQPDFWNSLKLAEDL